MKTKIIQTPKGRLMVAGGLPEKTKVALPSNVTFDGEKGSLIYKDKNGNPVFIPLPPGKWQPLGFLKDITEEQAKGIVRKVTLGYWMDYLHPKKRHDYMKRTAKESLISLVESEILLQNTLGEYPTEESTGLKYGMKYLSKVDDWEELQEKVLKSPVLFWEPQNK